MQEHQSRSLWLSCVIVLTLVGVLMRVCVRIYIYSHVYTVRLKTWTFLNQVHALGARVQG